VVYPNPFHQRVTILCNETITAAYLTDMMGRREQVRLFPDGTGRYSLDITAYPQATYLLTITTASGNSHTLRIVKQSSNPSR